MPATSTPGLLNNRNGSLWFISASRTSIPDSRGVWGVGRELLHHWRLGRASEQKNSGGLKYARNYYARVSQSLSKPLLSTVSENTNKIVDQGAGSIKSGRDARQIFRKEGGWGV